MINNNLFNRIEDTLLSLSEVDMAHMTPLAKFIYLSGREIDDSLLFWSSLDGYNADHLGILGMLSKFFEFTYVDDINTAARNALNALVAELKNYDKKETTMETFKKSQSDAKINELVTTFNSREKGMSSDAIEEINNVLETMTTMNKSNGEYAKNMEFLRACSKLTFGLNDTVDETDMGKVMAKLDSTHFGMDKAKELVLEFMAIKQLNKEAASPQFIFTGAAGTGKTTLAIRIAEALGRKVARVSLGGVGDAVILRGHSRTYIGSKCGRIMNAIIKSGVSNPVIVLDEIDKMDVQGSADAVLLEVLDPSQNVGFTDSYFNFPIDLSNVIFIATANYPEQIDAPIIDRMEVIPCDGYTLNEKIKIAKEYIIPKTFKDMGLSADKIKFTGPTIKYLVNGWTREAGMRSLEQAIVKILRGAAMKIVKGAAKVSITKKFVEDRMGGIIFEEGDTIDTTTPGTVNGLAIMGGFTGSVIQLESAYSFTIGARMLGDTGEMMNNSCEVVKEFLDNAMERYGIEEAILEEVGIATLLGRISTPVDGDSASITLLTSWVSLLLDRPVNPKVAMTGSISLNGSVRAIGGLDHKVAAGVRSGIETFIISEENRKDYDELPADIKKAATFHIVKHADEVMKYALNIEVNETEGE